MKAEKALAIHLLKRFLKTDLENREKNRNIFGQLSEADESDKLETLDEGVYLVSGADFIALVNEKTESIDYYVSLKQIKIEGINALYQSTVWRDGASDYTRETKGFSSLAGYVFFHYVLPKSNMIVLSDKEQTDRGQSFWFSRLRDAFKLGYRVYMIVDLKIVAEIPNNAELRKKVDEIWGAGKHNVRLAISTLTFDVPKVKV